MPYARQNKVRWTCSSMPGVEFDTAEPPEISMEAEYRFRKVGKDGKELTRSEVMFGDIAATGWISTSENGDLRRALSKGVLLPHQEATLTKVDIDDDDVPIPGTQASYIGSLKSYKEDGMDASGSDNIRFNMSWAIKGAVG